LDLGWPPTVILLVSAFEVARTKDMSHWCLANLQLTLSHIFQLTPLHPYSQLTKVLAFYFIEKIKAIDLSILIKVVLT
jgi:hypothetical protein